MNDVVYCSGVDARVSDGTQRVRLDKWLWAARFLKTRRLALEAIAGGKIHVDGVRPKPSKEVRVGQEISIRQGPYERIIRVKSISERRGPASEAAQLYEETPESSARREALQVQLRLEAAGRPRSEGRPTKRQRRKIHAFKQKL